MAEFVGYSGTAAAYRALLGHSSFQGVSPIGAYLALSGSSSPIEQIMELMRGVLQGDHPMFSFGGYVYLCYLLGECTDFRGAISMSDGDILCSGLITAQWRLRVAEEVDDDQIRLRVFSLMSHLVGHTGTLMTDMRVAMEHLKSKVLDAVADTANAIVIEGTSAYVTQQIGAATGYGAKVMTSLEGGLVPWAKFGLVPATIGAAANRAALKTALNIDLQDNQVNTLSVEEIAHCCNFIGRHNQDKVRAILVRALFISIAGICKGQNLTANWTTSRWSALKSQFEGLATTNKDVNKDTISIYAKRFIGSHPSLGSLYSALIYNHRIAEAMDLDIMRWMIEQARGTNITGLHMIADAMVKYESCSYSILRRMIPEVQFHQAARAMCITIQQPYGTLHGPIIAVQQYPDLAYVCLSVCMGSVETSKAMADGLLKKCLNDPRRLDALAQMISRCQNAGADVEMSVQKILNMYHVNGYPTNDGSCKFYAYPELADPTVVVGDDGPVPKLDLTKLTSTQFLGIQNQLREFTILDVVRPKALPNDTEFRIICEAFRTAVDQTGVDYATSWPGGNNTLAPRPLPAAVSAAMTTIGANLPETVAITVVPCDPPNDHTISVFPAPAVGGN